MMKSNKNNFDELMDLSGKTDQEKIEWVIAFHRSYISNLKTSVYEARRQITAWEKRLLSLENELKDWRENNECSQG